MEFVTGAKLASAIMDLFIAPGKLRCAVAFWGPDLARRARERNAEVVLDISMRGTSRNALRAFGLSRDTLPDLDSQVRVLDGLHAKIYLGESKAVVGSANASRNALGALNREPALFEAGVIIDRATDPLVYQQVEQAYIQYAESSLLITKEHFDQAVRTPINLAVSDRHKGERSFADPLLDRLAWDPSSFARTGFIFGDMAITANDLAQVTATFERQTGEKLASTSLAHICTFDVDDLADDKLADCSRIIFYWFGKGSGISAYTDVVRIVDEDRDVSYFGRMNWTGAMRATGNSRLLKADVWGSDGASVLPLVNLMNQRNGERLVAFEWSGLAELLEQGLEGLGLEAQELID